MKIKHSEKKLNNRGFSLLELIVVIAVMIVLVGAVIVSSSILDGSYVKEAESSIKDYLAIARTKSMSVAAKEWFMTITKDGDGYAVRVCKTTEDGGTEVTTVVEEKEFNKRVKVTFGDKVTMNAVDAGSDLRIYFKPSTGGVDKVYLGATEISKSGGIGYLSLGRGTYEITMKLFYNTGKCERE